MKIQDDTDKPAPDRRKKTTRKKAPAKKANPVEEIRRLAAHLGPDERNELRTAGFELPAFGDDTEDGEEYRYAYRCRACNDIGLIFVGTRFADSYGNELDAPNGTMQFHRLPWIQPNKPADEWNRARPECQHCGEALEQWNTRGGIGYLREELVVNLRQWLDSRAKDIAHMQSVRHENRIGHPRTTTVQLGDGNVVKLEDPQPGHMPGRPRELSPEEREAAREFGVEDMLDKDPDQPVGSGFRGNSELRLDRFTPQQEKQIRDQLITQGIGGHWMKRLGVNPR